MTVRARWVGESGKKLMLFDSSIMNQSTDLRLDDPTEWN